MSKESIGYLPSEVARLVLGYLKEIDADNSIRSFLKESNELAEYKELTEKGHHVSTSIFGMSLLEILDKYFELMNEQKDVDTSDDCDDSDDSDDEPQTCMLPPQPTCCSPCCPYHGRMG